MGIATIMRMKGSAGDAAYGKNPKPRARQNGMLAESPSPSSMIRACWVAYKNLLK